MKIDFVRGAASGQVQGATAQQRVVMNALVDVINRDCLGLDADTVLNCLFTAMRATALQVGMPEERFRAFLQMALDDNAAWWQRHRTINESAGQG